MEPAERTEPFGTDVIGDTNVDLSADVCKNVTRDAGDLVRCTHVHERFYRCNWWRSTAETTFDNPSVRGSQLGTTYRVHRSAFLEVTRTGGRLMIREVAPRPTPAFL